MTDAQTELLANLEALRIAVGATAVLRTILDDPWFRTVETNIRTNSPSHTIPADPSGFLYDFCHPLRGAAWFERDQELALQGRIAEVDEDGRFALAFAGIDPLKNVLPKIERRLAAFDALTFKRTTVQVKMNELRAAKLAPAFKNHLFELNVLGDLADRGVLVDIEDGATGVDGTIQLDGRDILVEATNTTQRVIPEFTGVFFGSVDAELNQVTKKVRKKVADGRQLARAAGKPTVLFMARTTLGASRESADAALEECFKSAAFSALSAAVIADSYRLHVTSWRPGTAPDVPLSENEVRTLEAWYSRR